MNALKRIGIRFFALKMYGLIHCPDTSEFLQLQTSNDVRAKTGRLVSI